MYPPDKRKRDEDNIVKAINDTLMKANLIADDSQIKIATNVKHKSKNPGCVKITLEEIYKQEKEFIMDKRYTKNYRKERRLKYQKYQKFHITHTIIYLNTI